MAGQAYPHPPQLAASLLISAVQVPDACVPAAPGWVVPAAIGIEGTGVAAGVSCVVTSGGAPPVFVEVVQPAASTMTITTAHRNT